MATWKTCDTGSEDDNISKIDARLHSIFQGLNVHKRTMARFGEMGVTTVQALNTIVDNRVESLDRGDTHLAEPGHGALV